MGASEETIRLLTSIDASLKQLLALQRQSAPAGGKQIASDRELDGKYGDPVLKFTPRDWTGPDFKNCHFSECPPELLDLVAESNDWFARKADEKNETTEKGKPVADFKRADAARARGWAKRMRDGKHHAPQMTEPAAAGWGSDDGY